MPFLFHSASPYAPPEELWATAFNETLADGSDAMLCDKHRAFERLPIPPEVIFATKLELAWHMLQRTDAVQVFLSRGWLVILCTGAH